jgi:FkbM family methyltransferase
MKIFYGRFDTWIDVTDLCEQLTLNDIISIPSRDSNRADYFTDPLPGVLKKIKIDTIEYDDEHTICINKVTGAIEIYNTIEKLQILHSTLNLNYGSFLDELPEQKMAVRYLKGNEKVLEIGGNIGRNSLVIASLVKELVTLESDEIIANQLIENRDSNQLTFHVECAALSNRKLIQYEWRTIPSDILFDGYKWVNTISLPELREKYKIEFDTLVLDCEGAFYYILMDMPDILDNINLIIMENDYFDISHKEYIDAILKKNFYVDYTESGGWGPCANNFFEVWKRI